ncbi:hypothetical protein D3C85_602740 [compost metagenome]
MWVFTEQLAQVTAHVLLERYWLPTIRIWNVLRRYERCEDARCTFNWWSLWYFDHRRRHGDAHFVEFLTQKTIQCGIPVDVLGVVFERRTLLQRTSNRHRDFRQIVGFQHVLITRVFGFVETGLVEDLRDQTTLLSHFHRVVGNYPVEVNRFAIDLTSLRTFRVRTEDTRCRLVEFTWAPRRFHTNHAGCHLEVVAFAQTHFVGDQDLHRRVGHECVQVRPLVNFLTSEAHSHCLILRRQGFEHRFYRVGVTAEDDHLTFRFFLPQLRVLRRTLADGIAWQHFTTRRCQIRLTRQVQVVAFLHQVELVVVEALVPLRWVEVFFYQGRDHLGFLADVVLLTVSAEHLLEQRVVLWCDDQTFDTLEEGSNVRRAEHGELIGGVQFQISFPKAAVLTFCAVFFFVIVLVVFNAGRLVTGIGFVEQLLQVFNGLLHHQVVQLTVQLTQTNIVRRANGWHEVNTVEGLDWVGQHERPLFLLLGDHSTVARSTTASALGCVHLPELDLIVPEFQFVIVLAAGGKLTSTEDVW